MASSFSVTAVMVLAGSLLAITAADAACGSSGGSVGAVRTGAVGHAVGGVSHPAASASACITTTGTAPTTQAAKIASRTALPLSGTATRTAHAAHTNAAVHTAVKLHAHRV